MTLEVWIEQQSQHAAEAMFQSISPVSTIKVRPGFDQTIRPRRGAIVASPVLAAYDPEPDYFFHWYRDSAIVVDALRVLFEHGLRGDGQGAAGGSSQDPLAAFADFVDFSIALADLDGRDLVKSGNWRHRIAPGFEGFLRRDGDLERAHGEALLSETRVNPDGTLDITNWGRPQNDGPALRALALLRWMRAPANFGASLKATVSSLLRADLAFTYGRWREPCFDIWEEESALHYYTLRVQAGALAEGAAWLGADVDDNGNARLAAAYRVASDGILRDLDGFWCEDRQIYRSREPGASPDKACDIAVILAAIHARGRAATHSVRDPRMHRTLAALEAIFEADYPINRKHAPGRAPALGRYRGDTYQGGGPWYVATLAAAEFLFRAAAATGQANDASNLRQRGDAFLETVRAFTPASGDMPEQFDRATGEPRSARHLAWSYAAFISCIAARRAYGIRP